MLTTTAATHAVAAGRGGGEDRPDQWGLVTGTAPGCRTSSIRSIIFCGGGAVSFDAVMVNEAPARAELRFLLQSFPDVQVVGEATNAEEAALLLDSVDYDVVLLDIRMPGGTGLDLAARRAQHHPAGVVFTTAYPDHAVDASDLAAAGYLVKPFDADRLGRALRRALGTANGDEDQPPPRRRALGV